MGMPPAAYSKALREPVYFLWDCREHKTKRRLAKFRSRSATGLRHGSGTVVCDHAVPFRILQRELLSLTDVTLITVRRVLDKYGALALITKKEESQLNKSGYRSKMPDDWDGVDPLARYKAVGIEIVGNVETPQRIL
jgi:hypothetical protein